MQVQLLIKRFLKNSTDGFSLLESLITILIIAIILSFAIPINRNFFQKNALFTQTEEIVSALHYARSEAALKGKTLTLTSLASNELNDWSSGMRLFIDLNNNHHYEKGETLLFEWHWNKKLTSLTWQGLYSYLLFTPTGLNSALAGTFFLCPQNIKEGKNNEIVMNRLGRIRVENNKKTCHTSLKL